MKHCKLCGRLLPEYGRVDKRFCSVKCRVKAWRKRIAEKRLKPLQPRSCDVCHENMYYDFKTLQWVCSSKKCLRTIFEIEPEEAKRQLEQIER